MASGKEPSKGAAMEQALLVIQRLDTPDSSVFMHHSGGTDRRLIVLVAKYDWWEKKFKHVLIIEGGE